MDWLEVALGWVRENETLLSGLAAVIVIGGVLVASFARLRAASRRLMPSPAADGAEPALNLRPAKPLHPSLRFCETSDGYRIAYSEVGEGPLLVRSLGWFTHLELEWQNPTARSFWERLAADHRVVRYDARGMGLSQRDVDEVSFETRLRDLEAVVDAMELERFALVGFSEGGSTAIAYAARHPERVSKLLLWGSFIRVPGAASDHPIGALFAQVREKWGKDDPVFHQLFATQFIPDGGAEHNRFFRELQRASATGEMAFRTMVSLQDVDVSDFARQVRVPTLVMHRRGDLLVSSEMAQELAATIPDARLMLLDGSNHWMWMEEPDTDAILEAVRDFVHDA